MPKKLKHKRITSRLGLLKFYYYRGIPVYLRIYYGKLFQYDVILKGELFTAAWEIPPENGHKKHTEQEIIDATTFIQAMAEATIDVKLSVKLSDEDKAKAELIVASHEPHDKQN